MVAISKSGNGLATMSASLRRNHSTAFRRWRKQGMRTPVLCRCCLVVVALVMLSSSRWSTSPKQQQGSLILRRSTKHRIHLHSPFDGSDPGASDQDESSSSEDYDFGSLQNNRRTRVHCKYHGNCPIGQTCINHECLPYRGIDLSRKQATNVTQIHKLLEARQRHEVCVQACKTELEWDEAYQYGSIPEIKHTWTARNGHGCVLTFQRTIPSVPPSSIPLLEWMKLRQHRLIRVDPTPITGVWDALCNFPCEYPNDCNNQDCTIEKTGSTLTARQLEQAASGQPKSCLPLRQMHHYDDVTIITGAGGGERFFRGLKNFVASAKYWAPKHTLVVYNLGMTPEQLQEVQSWRHVYKIHWLDGIPDHYPKHVHDLSNYAWKPIVINETVHTYKSILWLDAGATLTGPIDDIQTLIQRHGMFLVHGQDEDMAPLSHPGMYQYFGLQKSTFRGGPHYAGGIQGHVYPSRYIDSIVLPNAQCALQEACIEPPGSSLSNHRYDQTSVSILAYQPWVQAPAYTEYLAAERTALNRDLKQPSRMVIWTARSSCDFYTNLNLL